MNNCDPLALTTAVNTLAVAVASRLNDEDLDLVAAVLSGQIDLLPRKQCFSDKLIPFPCRRNILYFHDKIIDQSGLSDVDRHRRQHSSLCSL